MTKIKQLQEKIDKMDYWEARVLDFHIRYFGDEIVVVLENDNQSDYAIKFLKCYKVKYENDAKFRWKNLETRKMNKEQLGYFATNISVAECDEKEFVEITLDFPMLFAKILCKDVEIKKIIHNDKEYFWSKNED